MGPIVTKPNSTNNLKAYLHFASGDSFEGIIENLTANDPRLIEGIWGEAAFTTAMTGYQETMTDPSYLGQHIIFSYPHIGNYPANEKALQSIKTHATSIILRHSYPNEFMSSLSIPILSQVDTRALVKYLIRNPSKHKSVISLNPKAPSEAEFHQAKLYCSSLERVSIAEKKLIKAGENPIVVIDYGIKKAILDDLEQLGFPLVVYGHEVRATEVLAEKPRLIFLSNGPGDPRNYQEQVSVVKELLSSKVPIRAICLGHQLTGLALGAQIERLPYGHRGANHPVVDQISKKVLITSQNHGYALTESSLLEVMHKNFLNKDFFVHYSSLFDNSVEGISSKDHTIKTVQFHPEANPGPKDAHPFFDEIKSYLENKHQIDYQTDFEPIKIPQNKRIKKVIPYKKILVVGSGPIKIGQASEFDYSGTQACRSLKEEGIDVVLLNSNPATIMTDKEQAYKTYIEPITVDNLIRIIEKEDVDAILSTMGGQTALNTCLDLEKTGYLDKKKITLLGANPDTINKTEDRELFAKIIGTLGYKSARRFVLDTPQAAITCAKEDIGYPLILRRDFALGGKGAAVCNNESDLKNIFNSDISFPLTLEKSLLGFKEVELEVMVDSERNGVIICSIENIDPCGVHTGDSMTVAPVQTLSDHCYQQIRTMALEIAKEMGVVAGGANVQFAINPEDENDIFVIEMNPRVSRSSALASKATGYPIAKISALLAIGYTLKEILNDITKASPVSFEPTLDYVAVKIPLFPFGKFPQADRQLGPQMKSVGEVLALGSNFNEAFMKALRSLEMGLEIPALTQLKDTPVELSATFVLDRLCHSNELPLLTVLEALRFNVSPQKIYELSNISPWFIQQMKHFYEMESTLKENIKTSIFEQNELFKKYKGQGFSDKYLAKLLNISEEKILKHRLQNNIVPVYKAVDTCSGEFEAVTPYYYSCYLNSNDPTPFHQSEHKSVIIIGSGPNRIGQGIEFDYSCVKACQACRDHHYKAIMVNSNPETVSTDYDSSDRLYIAPLYAEDLFDIFSFENANGIITSFSGQTGITIREQLENSFRNELSNFNFLGSSLETLDLTEDRKKFDQIVKKTNICQTRSKEVVGYQKLVDAMTEIGFPVIIRPSYVIGGESMYIFYGHEDIEKLPPTMRNGLKNSQTSFLVENYLESATEYDVDLIRDKFGNTIFSVCEHIEQAGVHSGDSGMITPPIVLPESTLKQMYSDSVDLASELNIIGPVNIQFAVKNNQIYCIEANPRGSRTLPFLSKAYDISLPTIAVKAMLGEDISHFKSHKPHFYSVKQSTFPFDRFLKDDMILGPKMRSTGETMGVDLNPKMATFKSYLGNYPKLTEEGKILFSLSDETKEIIAPFLKNLDQLGFKFYATRGTCIFIQKKGFACQEVLKVGESGNDELAIQNLIDLLKGNDVTLVCNTPTEHTQSKDDGEYIRNSATVYGVPCFTRHENIKAVIESMIHGLTHNMQPYSLQELHNEL